MRIKLPTNIDNQIPCPYEMCSDYKHGIGNIIKVGCEFCKQCDFFDGFTEEKDAIKCKYGDLRLEFTNEKMEEFHKLSKHFEFDLKKLGFILNNNIEFKNDKGYWEISHLKNTALIYKSIVLEGREFRIKPEPGYRPFKNADEFFPHANKLIRVKEINTNTYSVVEFTDIGVIIRYNTLYKYDYLFQQCEFVSYNERTKAYTTEPCGVQE